MRLLAFYGCTAIGWFATSIGSAQTIQLPSFSSFSVNTTVVVPDAGIATAGGIRRTGSSWRGYGPLPAGSSRSSFAASAGAHAHVVIHDLQELDNRVLAGSTPNNAGIVERTADELFAGRLPSVAEIRRKKTADRTAASATQMAKAAATKAPSRNPKSAHSVVQRRSSRQMPTK